MHGRPSHPDTGREAGFTLFEALVVVAIVGLMLTLLVFRGPQRSPRLSLRAAVSETAGILRGARAQAIKEGRPVTVLLDSAQHGYLVRGLSTRMRSISRDVAISAPASGILFAPDGSSSGGDVGLAAGKQAENVSVDWLTGRVTVSSH